MKNPTLALLMGLLSLGLSACDGDTGSTSDPGTNTTEDTESSTNSNSDSPDPQGGIDYKPMTPCNGGAYDPNSGLCWEMPTSLSSYTAKEALAYCESLERGGHTDWRLPTISELRTFFRPGDNLAACLGLDWSLDWKEPPAGYCGVHDGCPEKEGCYSRQGCFKPGCPHLEGPAQHDGCYWDEYITGAVICSSYWSSSIDAEADRAWELNFRYPEIKIHGSEDAKGRVRCVRTGK